MKGSEIVKLPTRLLQALSSLAEAQPETEEKESIQQDVRVKF